MAAPVDGVRATARARTLACPRAEQSRAEVIQVVARRPRRRSEEP